MSSWVLFFLLLFTQCGQTQVSVLINIILIMHVCTRREAVHHCARELSSVAVLPGVVHTRLRANRGRHICILKSCIHRRVGFVTCFALYREVTSFSSSLIHRRRKMLCDNHQPYRKLGAVFSRSYAGLEPGACDHSVDKLPVALPLWVHYFSSHHHTFCTLGDRYRAVAL